MKTTTRALPSLFLAVILAGCVAKGYEGPARVDDEISKVTVSASSGVTIDRMVFDGRAFGGFTDVVELLPGRHSFEIRYHARFDEHCPKDDYLCGVFESGSCKGRLDTLAGRRYLVRLEGNIAYVSGSVLAKGYFDLFERSDEPRVGSIVCSGS